VSKRQRTFEYYLKASKLEKSAASATTLGFKGPATIYGFVVRSDLNGYSKWILEQAVDIAARVALLDDFFSRAVRAASMFRGVYYRDEGDCIITLFCPYFFAGTTFSDVLGYAKAVTGNTYGADQLTCKTTVSAGDLTFYQKGPEVLEDDWSVEGDPFVTAARLEAGVESTQSIYCISAEYEGGLETAAKSNFVQPGQRYFWLVDNEKVKVVGLQAVGGWVDVVVHKFIPGGRISS
jgi:hypothetical protein